ncbi:hypothetical protein ACFR99_16705 [Haloarchaeobius amylolyticus]|uniref:Secreted protein n=1 Tax=Haloarchaeobius amylolyticus TaxID=1198296 RepID=A0ABD6BKR3_9EURY
MSRVSFSSVSLSRVSFSSVVLSSASENVVSPSTDAASAPPVLAAAAIGAKTDATIATASTSAKSRFCLIPSRTFSDP